MVFITDVYYFHPCFAPFPSPHFLLGCGKKSGTLEPRCPPCSLTVPRKRRETSWWESYLGGFFSSLWLLSLEKNCHERFLAKKKKSLHRENKCLPLHLNQSTTNPSFLGSSVTSGFTTPKMKPQHPLYSHISQLSLHLCKVLRGRQFWQMS